MREKKRLANAPSHTHTDIHIKESPPNTIYINFHSCANTFFQFDCCLACALSIHERTTFFVRIKYFLWDVNSPRFRYIILVKPQLERYTTGQNYQRSTHNKRWTTNKWAKLSMLDFFFRNQFFSPYLLLSIQTVSQYQSSLIMRFFSAHNIFKHCAWTEQVFKAVFLMLE